MPMPMNQGASLYGQMDPYKFLQMQQQAQQGPGPMPTAPSSPLQSMMQNGAGNAAGAPVQPNMNPMAQNPGSATMGVGPSGMDRMQMMMKLMQGMGQPQQQGQGQPGQQRGGFDPQKLMQMMQMTQMMRGGDMSGVAPAAPTGGGGSGGTPLPMGASPMSSNTAAMPQTGEWLTGPKFAQLLAMMKPGRDSFTIGG